jgi:excinuclease UvrABC ATPase subunit
VIATGTPEEVLQNGSSHTAEALRKIMKASNAA